MWGHIIAGAILVLFLSKRQCNYFLVCAGASHVTRSRGRGLRTLQVEDEHAERITKLRAVHAVNFMINSESIAAVAVSRRKVASYRGGQPSIRQEVGSLIAFKSAIDSDPMGALKSWHPNDSSACAWAGVVCSTQDMQIPNQVHVIGLELRGRQLVGNLKSALQVLGNLLFLQRLDLSDNVFLGSIPAASLTNYSKLSYLNVSYNNLTGPIPSQLGQLVNLEGLDMEENNLVGEIPVSLANCTLLKVLNLGSNFLEGEIPPVLGKLFNLAGLSLDAKLPPTDLNNIYAYPIAYRSLSGSIPPALGNCSSLTTVNLGYNNHLGGELPADLSRLKRLQHLRLSNCNFEGALPMWLGNLTSLRVLSVANNRFHGGVPDVMGQLQDLRFLGLGSNNLSGKIPISITNCTKLSDFSVQIANFTGAIPPQLGLLKNLEKLYLDDNSFTGVLPSSLANCSALKVVSFGHNPFTPQILSSWMGSLSSLFYLYLADMNLQGKIPGELGQLSGLVQLHLFENNLSGEIPSSLANCTSLNILILGSNKLTGEIPSGIGQLSYLSYLWLDNNFLTGTFPTFVANLTQLEKLLIGGNSLTGTIDADFGRLQHLQEVRLGENQFGGSIPEELSNCSNLLRIDVTSNKLTGEIPPSLGNLTRLELLRVDLNKIGGMIPVDIVRCSRLIDLDLSSNVFEGSVLPTIGQLSSLEFLRLAHNNFNGVVPRSLGNCSRIRTLDLSYNQIIGTVPGDILSRMIPLTSLNLSHNRFSGRWPRQLSQMTQLQEIDVAVNNLSGVIPQSLESLPGLYFLNASYNDFEGPIPEPVVLKANLTGASFLGNPKLCGVILGSHRTCSNSSRSCEGFKCKTVWIPTMCGVLGAVLIALGIFCCMNINCWVNDNNKQRDLVINFAPHIMTASEQDVLAIIQGGEENVIGMGAKSVVYRGVLPSPGAPRDTFAIKVLRSRFGERNSENDVNINGRRRETDLVKEVKVMGQVRHRNILKVVSFCSTPNVEALILEYMPNGCLHKHLHGLGDACHLNWPERFNIAMGVAEAMVYLHHGNQIPLIHRDLKPSNILLDPDLEPKVADFGLSKFVGENRDGKATASTICGTIGYMPPEYATGTTVSTKGDVYSYGVVLLELLTGIQPTSWENLRPSGSSNSRDYRSINEFLEESSVELLDSTLKHEATMDSHKSGQMMLLKRVALFCTIEAPERRPSMVDVLGMLTQIKETGLVAIPPRKVTDLANETTGYSDGHPNETTSYSDGLAN